MYLLRARATVSQRGGAIYLTQTSSPASETAKVSATVIRSTFRGTSAKRGGAICVYDGELTIRDSTFEQSSTTQDGGAVYVRNSNANITRTSFRDAHADSGGLLYVRNSNVTIGDSNFENGTAALGGGCIYVDEGSVAQISDSTFNYCTAIHDGGALYLEGRIDFDGESAFTSNEATQGSGGALYLAWSLSGRGANGRAVQSVADDEAHRFELRHARFERNSALLHGGAMHVDAAFLHPRKSHVLTVTPQAHFRAGMLKRDVSRMARPHPR